MRPLDENRILYLVVYFRYAPMLPLSSGVPSVVTKSVAPQNPNAGLDGSVRIN